MDKKIVYVKALKDFCSHNVYGYGLFDEQFKHIQTITSITKQKFLQKLEKEGFTNVVYLK